MRASDTAPAYEWLFTLCGAVFIVGLYLDGWAHNHLPSALETFFTPWHAVFYAGYFLLAFCLVAWTLSRRDKRGSLIDAVPPGHGLSLAGALLFFVGGIGDMTWHLVFGIEDNIEALLSPTHLLLATGGVMMISGGMRHFWATRNPGQRRGFIESLPFLLSAAFTLCLILFMAQYGQFTEPEAMGIAPRDPFYPQAVTILGALLFTVALIGMLTTILRRDRLPFGGVTFMLTLPVIALSLMRFGTELIPAALFAGILGDLLLVNNEARVKRITGMRIFSFMLPFLFYTFVMIVLPLRHGPLWWSVHMVAGLPVLAGFAGLLTGCIAWPPKQAVERTGY